LDLTERIVTLLLALQVVCVAVMLSLDSLSSVSEAIFAVFLAVDLLSLAVVSHVYRLSRAGDEPSKYFMLACLCAMLVLLFASLTLA
jgi:hypothetical protein